MLEQERDHAVVPALGRDVQRRALVVSARTNIDAGLREKRGDDLCVAVCGGDRERRPAVVLVALVDVRVRGKPADLGGVAGDHRLIESARAAGRAGAHRSTKTRWIRGDDCSYSICSDAVGAAIASIVGSGPSAVKTRRGARPPAPDPGVQGRRRAAP